MKAQLLKKESGQAGGYHVRWFLKLEEPISYTDWSGEVSHEAEYIMASARNDKTPYYHLFETYLFPVDADFKVLNWGELEGSRKNTTDIAAILEEAGYEVDYSLFKEDGDI